MWEWDPLIHALLKKNEQQPVVTVAISMWWPPRTLVRGVARWFRSSALESTQKNESRPAGKLIVADICKGIFVISQAPWFWCPILELQLFWDGGNIIYFVYKTIFIIYFVCETICIICGTHVDYFVVFVFSILAMPELDC
jgi:hypothetical protein